MLVEHHEREAAVALHWVAVVKRDDGQLLVVLEPVVARDVGIVLVDDRVLAGQLGLELRDPRFELLLAAAGPWRCLAERLLGAGIEALRPVGEAAGLKLVLLAEVRWQVPVHDVSSRQGGTCSAVKERRLGCLALTISLPRS